MKTISMLQFRHKAAQVIATVRKGQSVLLTYRGKPVARLEPVAAGAVPADDPFYRLSQLADGGGRSLTNEEIDRLVYGP